MDAFAAARLVVGAGFLAVAAVSDLRTRRVRDELWVAMGTIGLVLLAIDIVNSYWWVNDWFYFGSAAILFYSVFYGQPLFEEDGFHLRPVRILVLGAAAALFVAGLLLPNPNAYIFLPAFAVLIPDLALAAVPALIVVYEVFYQIGFLHGGADTKALIALTLVFPLALDTSPFPLLTTPIAFPFSFIALINAAIVFLVIPVAYLVMNAVRGDLAFPMALFGTRADLDRLPQHAWLMEKVDKRGEAVVVLFPRRGGDRAPEVEKLRAVGRTRVWVTHQVPFMVPLLAGTLLAFFVGNLLMAFLVAVLPRP